MKGTGKRKTIVKILILLAIIAAVVIFYLLIIKPTINGYVVKAQIQGVQYAVLTIMQQASTCKQVPLYAGNITMKMIWTDCLTNSVNPTEPINQTK
jgi:hypothetical protein